MAKNTLTTAFYQTEKDLKHPIPIRAYKDRIFRMIFKEKRALLALYNAMNDTAYQDPEELVITTLENAIYLGMKNDVSFMICDRLFLYEHQSTKNPNMPLRNLLYVADLYSVLTKDMFLYGELPVAIPEPRFVVFYNGEQKMEERSVLRLSDLYHPRTEHPYLELETLVLNINKGYNAELMEKQPPKNKNVQEFWKETKKYRLDVLCNSNVSKRVRAQAGLMLLGYSLTQKVIVAYYRNKWR